jgi:hypothetical protein
MIDEEKTQQWHHAIDRSISRAIRSEEPFTAESIIDDAGLILCAETARYLCHVLTAITPGPICKDDAIPVEERIECLLRVNLSCVDQLSDEAKARASNTQQTWRAMREMYEECSSAPCWPKRRVASSARTSENA